MCHILHITELRPCRSTENYTLKGHRVERMLLQRKSASLYFSIRCVRQTLLLLPHQDDHDESRLSEPMKSQLPFIVMKS